MKKTNILISLFFLVFAISCSEDDTEIADAIEPTPYNLVVNKNKVSHTTIPLEWEASVTNDSTIVTSYIYLEGNRIKEENTDTDFTLI